MKLQLLRDGDAKSFLRRLFAHSRSDWLMRIGVGAAHNIYKTENNAINSGRETLDVCFSLLVCFASRSHLIIPTLHGGDVIWTETSPTHLSRKFSINTIPTVCARVECRSAKQPYPNQGPQSHAESTESV